MVHVEISGVSWFAETQLPRLPGRRQSPSRITFTMKRYGETQMQDSQSPVQRFGDFDCPKTRRPVPGQSPSCDRGGVARHPPVWGHLGLSQDSRRPGTGGCPETLPVWGHLKVSQDTRHPGTPPLAQDTNCPGTPPGCLRTPTCLVTAAPVLRQGAKF